MDKPENKVAQKRAHEGGGFVLHRDKDSEEATLTGHAAVFNEETVIAGVFREVIRPGAFDRALEEAEDVVLLLNHGGAPFARTRAGTLKLSVDKRGLSVESQLDMSDPEVVSMVAKMRRGDLDKMSFGFIPTKETWNEAEDDEELPLVEVQEVRLFDVSVVNFPAYDQTDTAVRALEEARTAPPSTAETDETLSERSKAWRAMSERYWSAREKVVQLGV